MLQNKLKIVMRIFTVAFFLFFYPAVALGAIKVLPESGTDSAMLADVQKTAELFNQILYQDMNVTLNQDVKVFICPTQDNYTEVLQKEFHMPADSADREAKLTGGMSSQKYQVVALKGSSPSMRTPNDRTYNMGHELFHQVQAQLSNCKNDKALHWMLEGTADFIGARVAEKSGYQSLEKWKLDRINKLRNVSSYAAPSDVLHCSLKQWASLMEQDKYPYVMSDLMVFYLLSQQPKEKGYVAIAEYFRMVGSLGDGDAAFEQVFGLNINQFLKNFESWFSTMRIQPAQVHIVTQDGVSTEASADVERTAVLTRQFFQEIWDADLRSEQRIVLTGNKVAYAAALMTEFGLNSGEAEQKAKNSVWFWSGSTTILDMGSLPSPKQRIFVTATTMVKRFQAQTTLQAISGISWLSNGSAYVVAAHTVELAGVDTLEKYKAFWLSKLRKMPDLPELTELQTKQDWETARNKYGSNTVSVISELATVYLVEKYGFKSINEWFQATKDIGDAEKAFIKVYGMSISQFADDFKGFVTAEMN